MHDLYADRLAVNRLQALQQFPNRHAIATQQGGVQRNSFGKIDAFQPVGSRLQRRGQLAFGQTQRIQGGQLMAIAAISLNQIGRPQV